MATVNWSRQLEQLEAEEIPYDVTFNVYEKGTKIGRVKAHKMVLAIASPVFRGQFFTCDTQDRTASEIDIYDTTYSAFQVMIDVIYSKYSLTWWQGSSNIEEVFDMLSLVRRYMIDDLVAVTKEGLATFVLSYENLVDSVAIAERYFGTDLESESKQLHLRCVKKLKCYISGPDGGSLAAKFLEDHADKLEAAVKLLGHSQVINCLNCRAKDFLEQGCLHGQMVFENFRDGLGVTFTCEEMNSYSFMVTKDSRGGKNMKLGGANNHTGEENLYLKDFHTADANDIDGGRLYYNCKPGEYVSIL